MPIAISETFQGQDCCHPFSLFLGVAVRHLSFKNDQAPPPVDPIDNLTLRLFAESFFYNQCVYGEVRNQFCTCMPEVDHQEEG